MIKPFHLSFVVPNLEAAKKFYIDVLGCEVGRDVGDWIDILFFGHQVTIHQEKGAMIAKPLDHFGVIMDENEWTNTSNQLSSNGIIFEMKPTIRNKGTDIESGKYLVKDPAGNLLEFKYYSDFSQTVGGKNL
ncbi:MAG: extradiol dioxygenase family protein [Cryomorphaceae bacterium]|jgi:extradiol dioxygenase family protein